MVGATERFIFPLYKRVNKVVDYNNGLRNRAKVIETVDAIVIRNATDKAKEIGLSDDEVAIFMMIASTVSITFALFLKPLL
jgi:hypothetical protein